MEIPLYIIHWLINPIIYFFLYLFFIKKEINLAIVFLTSFFILLYLQALNVFFMYENVQYLLVIWFIPYVFFSIYIFFNKFIFKRNISGLKVSVEHIKFKKIEKYLPLISLTFIIITIIYVLDIGISKVALFHLLLNPGESVAAMELRIDGLNSNISNVLTIVYSYTRSLFFPLYSSILFVLMFERRITKFHFFIIFIFGASFMIFTTAKAPLAIYFICILITYSLITSVKFNWKVILLLIISLSIPSLIYPLIQGAVGKDFITVAFEGLFRRFTWVPTHTTAVYFNIFPDFFPHTGFSSNRIIAFLLGKEYIGVAGLVYSEYYVTSISGGLVNTSFIGSFYADWGIVGVLFGSILVSSIIAILDYFYDLNKESISLAFKALTIVAVAQLMLTNFYSVSLGRGLISIPIMYLLINLLIQKSKGGINNEIIR